MILGVSASPSTKLPRPVPKDSGVAFLQTNHHPIKLHNDDGSANWAEVHARHHAITARYGGYDGRTRKRYTENVTTVESGTFYLNYVSDEHSTFSIAPDSDWPILTRDLEGNCKIITRISARRIYLRKIAAMMYMGQLTANV